MSRIDFANSTPGYPNARDAYRTHASARASEDGTVVLRAGHGSGFNNCTATPHEARAFAHMLLAAADEAENHARTNSS